MSTLQRDVQGRNRTPPEFDSPEYRAELLSAQRASGASVRELAEELGRAKSSVARDLAQARVEERAKRDEAREIEAARFMPKRTPEPERRPGASVMLGVPGVGLTDVHGHALAATQRLGRLHRRENSSDAQTAVRAARELDRLAMQANVRAGLSPAGDATVETPLGRYSYDPFLPDEVERMRRGDPRGRDDRRSVGGAG